MLAGALDATKVEDVGKPFEVIAISRPLEFVCSLVYHMLRSVRVYAHAKNGSAIS